MESWRPAWSASSCQQVMSASRNTGVVLVPSRAWKCIPATISNSIDICEVPAFSVRVTKITPRIGFICTHILPF